MFAQSKHFKMLNSHVHEIRGISRLQTPFHSLIFDPKREFDDYDRQPRVQGSKIVANAEKNMQFSYDRVFDETWDNLKVSFLEEASSSNLCQLFFGVVESTCHPLTLPFLCAGVRGHGSATTELFFRGI